LPQNVDNDVGSAKSLVGVPEEKKSSLKEWITEVYNIDMYPEEQIEAWNEMFSYKGFNRDDVLKQLHAVTGNNRQLTVELIIVSTMRGPQAASRIKLSNGKTPIEMNIPASGGQGTKTLTLNKIQAATADLAAYFMKKMNIPKRLNMELPGWLQFPSAGSIRLPRALREQHIEFSKRFSTQIGGTFQEQIYMQMETNAYLDERLRLFE
jgi:hypothetical protein